MNEVTVQSVFPVSAVQNHDEFGVDGRQLWTFLGKNMEKINRDLPKAIEDAMLISGEDYKIERVPTLAGGSDTTIYTFTADAGKDIAMMASTDKGKEVRAYFRSCEKVAIATASYMIEDPIERAKAWIVEQEAKRALEYKIAEQAPMVEFAETVIASENSEKIGDYAKSLSKMYYVTIGPNKLFQWLRENKYLMVGRDASERNKPYQKHIENGLFEIKYEVSAKGKVLVPYITGKGQFQLSKIIVEYFTK